MLALPGGTAEIRGLARAAMALDAGSIRVAVERAVAEHGVIPTWTELLCPVLVAVGERWAATGEGVEVEHLLAETAGSALRAVSIAPEPRNGRPVLLACAPEEQHSLPLAALAAALAERGIGARLLGGGLPLPALRAAVRRTGPAALMVWAHAPGSADGPVRRTAARRAGSGSPAPRSLGTDALLGQRRGRRRQRQAVLLLPRAGQQHRPSVAGFRRDADRPPCAARGLRHRCSASSPRRWPPTITDRDQTGQSSSVQVGVAPCSATARSTATRMNRRPAPSPPGPARGCRPCRWPREHRPPGPPARTPSSGPSRPDGPGGAPSPGGVPGDLLDREPGRFRRLPVEHEPTPSPPAGRCRSASIFV